MLKIILKNVLICFLNGYLSFIILFFKIIINYNEIINSNQIEI